MRKALFCDINKIFAALSQSHSVYLPVNGKDSQAHYQKWEEGVEYSKALNTSRSAKDFFFPQTENLMDFKIEGKTIEVIDTRDENEDFVLFGVRPCDVRSFAGEGNGGTGTAIAEVGVGLDEIVQNGDEIISAGEDSALAVDELTGYFACRIQNQTAGEAGAVLVGQTVTVAVHHIGEEVAAGLGQDDGLLALRQVQPAGGD
ncbi:MAG: hypothetical protein IKT54_04225, partial [Clostridia bacterium]|nr:hypothetical protein [Clostridia bacterium]